MGSTIMGLVHRIIIEVSESVTGSASRIVTLGTIRKDLSTGQITQ